jgi:hypothetical protein
MHFENSGVLRCPDVVSLGYWFPTFRRIVMRSSSRAKQLRDKLLNCLALDTSTAYLTTGRNFLSLWKPQISQLFVLSIGVKGGSFLIGTDCTG